MRDRKADLFEEVQENGETLNRDYLKVTGLASMLLGVEVHRANTDSSFVLTSGLRQRQQEHLNKLPLAVSLRRFCPGSNLMQFRFPDN
jgi:hypothetical protein